MSRRKNGGGFFEEAPVDPAQIRLRDLLEKEQVMAGMRALRRASQAFAGVFEFHGQEILLLDDVYAEKAPEYPRGDILSLITQIRDTDSAQFGHTKDGLAMMGQPIRLTYEGRTYIKGCLAGIPPAGMQAEDDSNLGVLQLLADVFSDRMSTAFSYLITNLEHEAIEKELRLDRNRLTAVIDSIGAGLVLVNRKMRIAWHNQVIADQLGVSELEGESCYDVFHGNFEISGACPVHLTFETGQRQTGKFTSLHPAPDRRYFDVTTTPVSDSKGSVAQVLALIHDVTEKHVAMEERNRFFRNVSHELRTPLTSIIGFSELLEISDEPLTRHQQTTLARIDENAHRLLNLVNDLLDLSKIGAAGMKVEPMEVDLREFIEQVAEDMLPLAMEKDLTLSVDVSEDIPEIITDEQKLGQILTNLVSNAIKFTPEGSVSVSVMRNDSTVAIAVTDTGIGIPAEELSKVFKEFHQGSLQSKGQRGTGLGLAIAQGLALLLGGEIAVESEVGVGSTFRVSLPLAVDIDSLS